VISFLRLGGTPGKMAASFAGKARGARGARPERPSKIWGARELRLDLATVRAVAERHTRAQRIA
jgi:hypothetical protein